MGATRASCALAAQGVAGAMVGASLSACGGDSPDDPARPASSREHPARLLLAPRRELLVRRPPRPPRRQHPGPRRDDRRPAGLRRASHRGRRPLPRRLRGDGGAQRPRAGRRRPTGVSLTRLHSIDAYDTILLASPIWNVRPPMIMPTFAERYDFTGKTVYPITTYAMSGLGQHGRGLRAGLPRRAHRRRARRARRRGPLRRCLGRRRVAATHTPTPAQGAQMEHHRSHDHPQQRRRDARPRARRLPDPARRDPRRRHGRAGAGYRHIDTAAAYGNEREVGEAVAASGLDRAEVFLETKIWISDYGYDETLHGFEKSAGKLGVDQIDLLILHQALPSALRPDPRGLPRAGDAARRRQGPRHRRQQLHGRPPHRAARHGRRSCRRSTRSRSTPTSSSARCRPSAPSTASSPRPGRRSAASPSTATASTRSTLEDPVIGDIAAGARQDARPR